MSKTPKPPRRNPVSHPEAIFHQAVSTETSSVVLATLSVTGTSGWMPALGILPTDQQLFSRLMIWRAVTEAFALELYLKTLAVLDHGSHLVPEHDLRVLFDDLKPESQAAVRTEFVVFEKAFPNWGKPGNGRPALDFDSALDLSSDAFQRWRYVHEQKIIGGYYAHTHMVCARRVLVQRRADWASVAAHFPATWTVGFPIGDRRAR